MIGEDGTRANGKAPATDPAAIGDPAANGLMVADGWPANLRFDHRQELQRSGLTAETVCKAGIYTETNHAILGDLLGWDRPPSKKMGAALVFPFRRSSGVNGYCRIKFSSPRKDRSSGKPVKYESPRGRDNEVYIPPGTLAFLDRADANLLITEGEKKALAADQYGFHCLGLVGVFGWKPRRAEKLLPDLERVAWKCRNVYLAFDSDIAENRNVQDAEARLAAHLTARGAVVRCVRIPGEAGAKVGLDDLLVARGPDGLYDLLAVASDPPPVAAVEVKLHAAAMDPAPEVEAMIEAERQDGLSRLRFWRGAFMRYRAGAYHYVATSEVEARLVSWLNERWKRITTGVRANCRMQIEAQTLLPGDVEPPAWLGEPRPWPANEVLVARNGLVHLPSFVEGAEHLLPPTPRFFSTSALEFDFDAVAPQPATWNDFLRRLWPNDPDSIDLLREWFGYCLTPDTSQHKILFIVGPPRSGKGTIARVLCALVGKANVAGPTLASLTTTFGLQPLLGKSLAVIGDARLGGRGDGPAITERLLAISGEDPQTVDRKNLEAVTCKLPTRFVILTNELPRLADASGALPNRMIPLCLTETWLGREDTVLTERLLRELPGILLWAVVGWGRLRQAGRFSEPAGSADVRRDLGDLASPVAAFVRDCCDVGQEHGIACSELYAGYKQWREANGGQHVEDERGFGRLLKAAFPRVTREQSRVSGERRWFYRGVTVTVCH